MNQPPVALTIAGSDSGGGAGIQADLATFAAFGVHGTCAITAVTAQNTLGVTAIHPVGADTVAAQLDAVTSDFDVAAAKTGMLGDPDLIDLIAHRRPRNLVVDPVMAATTGSRLHTGDPTGFLTRLAPVATVVTPNLPETEALLGHPVTGLAEMRDAARELAGHGPRAVVVKGGHATGPRAVDIVWCDGELTELATPRVDTRNTHGTGCTLSAAIAAALALGRPLPDAIADAKNHVTAGLVSAADWRLGAGAGPLDHHPRRTR